MPATAQILVGKVRENEMSGGTLRYKISDHMADLTVISTSIPRTLRSSFIITLSPAADCAPQRALPRSHWTCARPCPTPPGGTTANTYSRGPPLDPAWIFSGPHPGLHRHLVDLRLRRGDLLGSRQQSRGGRITQFLQEESNPVGGQIAWKIQRTPGTGNNRFYTRRRDAWPGRDNPSP